MLSSREVRYERVIHVLYVTAVIRDVLLLVYESIVHHYRLLFIRHTRKPPHETRRESEEYPEAF